MQNYRQFKDLKILFNKSSDNDLHVVIGVMGTGKTNLLNAFNWVLYGNEPYLSRDSMQLPILNLRTIEETDDQEDQNVLVEMWVETEDKGDMIFTRCSTYTVYKSDKMTLLPSHKGTKLEVKLTDDKGNTKIYEDEGAYSHVERLVPSGIREFFFFDGERLDNYFREATGQNIHHAIFEISQLNLLERVYSKIDQIREELEKESGKQNPEIEEARKRRDHVKETLEQVITRIEECSKQSKISTIKTKELEENLRGLPDIEILEDSRKSLLEDRKERNNIHYEKVKEKKNLLFEYSKLIFLWPIINKVSSIIEIKKENGEFPPTIDKALIEKIKQDNFCTICGRSLDDKGKVRVNKLLNEIKLSPEIAKQLMFMESPMLMFKRQIREFKNKLEKITKEIKREEKELTRIENKIDGIDRKLSGFDSEKIRGWAEQRNKFEKIHDESQQQLGILMEKKKHFTKELEEKESDLSNELKKKDKFIKVKKQIDFCHQALDIANKTKFIIMNETRKKIEAKTRDAFLSLNWRHKTFKDVKISKDYNINVIHTMGYECLGSISGGERELLTLAFTMGLHEVSGFDAPIVVDRPLAMVSGNPRENIVNVLTEISKKKQTILLFTPNDYSPEIAKILDSKATSRRKISISADEKELKMEVL
jgi:DNA sulfur modification protein DndD